MYKNIIILLILSLIFLYLGVKFNSYKFKIVALIHCCIGILLLFLDYKYNLDDLSKVQESSPLILSSPTSTQNL